MTSHISQILEFQKARDWKQFHSPKNLAISLALEASEVLEIFQWSQNHNIPRGKNADLGQELADVYYYLLLLAHESGIDLSKEFEKKMAVNKEKYPIDKAKGTSRKYNEI